MRVADYVAQFIAEHPQTGKTVFLVAGGGSMHLVDAIGSNKKLAYVCNHHEQASAIAAEGYARVSNRIGVACVTSGPGGTNAMTGVLGAWLDSIPTLVISGQVKRETTVASQPELRLRQLGDQEINIVDIVRPVTKYAVMVTDKNRIREHLEHAVFAAKHDRPGPVWVDIPLDIQAAEIDPKRLPGFTPPAEPAPDYRITEVLEALQHAERPLVIAGNGVTLSGAVEEFRQLVKKLQVPVAATFARYDIIKDDDLLYAGRFGCVGQRAGNFAVQNSDLILAIGTRLNIRAVSYQWQHFGRGAKKIVVDIDANELRKHTLKVDLPIHAEAGAFIRALSRAVRAPYVRPAWIARCQHYRERYPTITPERQAVADHVDSYNFFDVLSDCAADQTVFVLGNGTACVAAYQSLRLSGDQRVVVNSGCASMGYDLPAAIGAYFGAGKTRPVVCVTGDGSLQMNIQELQTIRHYGIPVKLFVLNNAGYISIRNTQRSFCQGRFVGSGPSSGVSCPDTVAVAQAYGLTARRIARPQHLKAQLQDILRQGDAVVCDIILNPSEETAPKVSSAVKPDGTVMSKPLEDMFPFLDREEFKSNMITPVIDETG
ncbi:MAG: thiamine pyrophosphate-binding protein [Patescibacteria group bacterium]|nr:thiamine pyrophosphate-binding protein [Patescibacteria group bacterium]